VGGGGWFGRLTWRLVVGLAGGWAGSRGRCFGRWSGLVGVFPEFIVHGYFSLCALVVGVCFWVGPGFCTGWLVVLWSSVWGRGLAPGRAIVVGLRRWAGVEGGWRFAVMAVCSVHCGCARHWQWRRQAGALRFKAFDEGCALVITGGAVRILSPGGPATAGLWAGSSAWRPLGL